nr:alpha/beta hydrolase [uncultured Pedobacter sp.]
MFAILGSNMAHSQVVITKNYIPPAQKQREIGTTTFIQNIRYGTIPKIADDSISDRILDLYLPKKLNDTEKLPVFIFIHGGGFSGGDKGMVDLCSKIADQGFAVISINYRLTLKYKKDKNASCSTNMSKGLPIGGSFYPLLNEAIKNASDDAIMALGWIKSNSSKYKLNTNKVAICGGSAGSMTALYVAYASHQKVLPIKVVVDLWGGLENTNIKKKMHQSY